MIVQEPEVSLETAQTLGLLEEEYNTICEVLGRTPNFTEISVYSVMWSEHCSYKNSIHWLKQLPKSGKHILAEAGDENAGLVDIGDGLACAFKIESHNHPSAIEPYQGAATGVGGIHRDIFTMGARPLAALNSLRFGSIDNERTKHLMKGIVKGIGDYGNCFGIPTVGGEVYFHDCYQINPLVNAMSVGVVNIGETISATSEGVGNPVYIVGSATGKDGIHGATFASTDITEDSSEKLPAVQVGDPFQEKLLLEATLEAIKTGAIVGMQDMGAAGITCSTSEMSEKGGHGMKIYLDKVPTRHRVGAPDSERMVPFEILLSESQERMLVVVKKGMEADIEKVFDKWDLNCAIIGEVTEGEMLEYYMDGELVAHMPAPSLVLGGGTPVYEREYTEPAYYNEYKSFSIDNIEEPTNLKAVAEKLVASPNIASKRWVYQQYDSMVGIANICTNNKSDASVIRVPGSPKGLAASVDCNSRYVHNDPFVGSQIAVSEAARNVVCSGGSPVAITNCLNFGNPYNPEVFWQFVNSIKGMSAACLKFDTPVTGGNVSFYNQSSDEGPVNPTPVIGMLGVLDNLDRHTGIEFQHEGDAIIIIGDNKNDINASEYLQLVHGIEETPAPYFDLDQEHKVQQVVYNLISDKMINSAHDVSEGGIFVNLLESAENSNIGFDACSLQELRKDAYWFGEAQSRVIVSCSADQKENLINKITAAGVKAEQIGTVGGKDIIIDGENWGNVSDWGAIYNSALENKL